MWGLGFRSLGFGKVVLIGVLRNLWEGGLHRPLLSLREHRHTGWCVGPTYRVKRDLVSGLIMEMKQQVAWGATGGLGFKGFGNWELNLP